MSVIFPFPFLPFNFKIHFRSTEFFGRVQIPHGLS
jgi:hypothetical protein